MPLLSVVFVSPFRLQDWNQISANKLVGSPKELQIEQPVIFIENITHHKTLFSKAHDKSISSQKLTATQFQLEEQAGSSYPFVMADSVQPMPFVRTPSLLDGAGLPGFPPPWNSQEASAYIPTWIHQKQKNNCETLHFSVLYL